MENIYEGNERRDFERLKLNVPLAYKVCKKETISKLLEGYTSDISQSGLLCILNEKVSENDILWLSFDRSTLEMCKELEHRSLIYQNGIIAKVVRINDENSNIFSVGVKFITREEKNQRFLKTTIELINQNVKR